MLMISIRLWRRGQGRSNLLAHHIARRERLIELVRSKCAVLMMSACMRQRTVLRCRAVRMRRLRLHQGVDLLLQFVERCRERRIRRCSLRRSCSLLSLLPLLFKFRFQVWVERPTPFHEMPSLAAVSTLAIIDMLLLRTIWG